MTTRITPYGRAVDISNTPTGVISSTDVQGAIDEIGTDINGYRSKVLEYDGTLTTLPTYIYRGIRRGLSFPIYASVNENVLFTSRVPFRWDGSTNIHIYFISSTSGAEDVGDKYRFQLSWESSDVGDIIPATTTETLLDEVTLTTVDAFRSYILDFELTSTTIVSGQNIQFELRRVAASALEVTAEPIIWHWDARFKMNQISTTSESGY